MMLLRTIPVVLARMVDLKAALHTIPVNLARMVHTVALHTILVNLGRMVDLHHNNILI
jgi:hypothetical protein